MKYFEGDNYKIIPQEFEGVCQGFPFDWTKKRLTQEEREGLGIKLSKINVMRYFSEKKDAQSEHAFRLIGYYSIESVIWVQKHDGHAEKMIISGGQRIRIPASLIEFWPDRLIEVVKEF